VDTFNVTAPFMPPPAARAGSPSQREPASMWSTSWARFSTCVTRNVTRHSAASPVRRCVYSSRRSTGRRERSPSRWRPTSGRICIAPSSPSTRATGRAAAFTSRARTSSPVGRAAIDLARRCANPDPPQATQTNSSLGVERESRALVCGGRGAGCGGFSCSNDRSHPSQSLRFGMSFVHRPSSRSRTAAGWQVFLDVHDVPVRTPSGPAWAKTRSVGSPALIGRAPASGSRFLPSGRPQLISWPKSATVIVGGGYRRDGRLPRWTPPLASTVRTSAWARPHAGSHVGRRYGQSGIPSCAGSAVTSVWASSVPTLHAACGGSAAALAGNASAAKAKRSEASPRERFIALHLFRSHGRRTLRSSSTSEGKTRSRHRDSVRRRIPSSSRRRRRQRTSVRIRCGTSSR
jgi:hypothetical protein